MNCSRKSECSLVKRVVLLSIALTLIITVSLVASFGYNSLNRKEGKSIYVGVTFGGDNSTDAKLLIDKVKEYTNLFILQSGDLQKNITTIIDIGDYAINSGLSFIGYFGSIPDDRSYITSFLSHVEAWGNNFLGIYFDDELSGKMLDMYNYKLYDATLNETVTKYYNGQVSITKADGTIVDYIGLGYVLVYNPTSSPPIFYQPNGDIGVEVKGVSYIFKADGTVFEKGKNGSIDKKVENTAGLPQIESYAEILAKRPLMSSEDAANRVVNNIHTKIDWLHNQSVVRTFTSDYALYWYDYLGGYDVVLAQLGWNNTLSQEIGLVRGAANLQDKDWGTIITWKYTQPPYLATGDEMYQQMLTSYQCGAKYVVVFNYAKDMDGPYGTLQEEHFQALKRFWNEVVTNPNVKFGGIKAEAALVLPNNFGWGMRNANDTVWGLWAGNKTTDQIWDQLHVRLGQYGSKLDIVYDDPTYPVLGKYGEIYYWNK
jgi:hypothetical protein